MSEDHRDETVELSEPTRRALLSGTAAGASALLAGCGGDGGDGTATGTPATGTSTEGQTDTPTATETTAENLAHVSGQTLSWFTMQDVQSMSWIGMGPFPYATGDYVQSFNRMAYGLTMQPEVRIGRFGEPELETYESVDLEPSEVTVTIRDDAKWSNGDDITPPDVMGTILANRLFPSFPSFEGVRQTPSDRQSLIPFYEAILDYEVVDDKTFRFMSDGLFGHLDKEDVYRRLTVDNAWGGARQNTKLEPYTEWWDAIEDFWDQAKNGEIQPWGADFDFHIINALREEVFGPRGWSQNPEENTYDQYWEKYYQDPDNVVTTGAWTLDAINGDKSITLKPNEHHRHSDKLNFDQIKIIARKSDRASRAALSANSQDYYRGTIPAHIANSFPDDIEQRLQPAGGGLGFAVDHGSELFDDPNVRKALLFAIDKERLARSVHSTKFDPIVTVGGHGWDATEELDESWIEDNLTDYERDLDRAAQLMQDAGYQRSGGSWVDGDGNPVTLEIPTSDETPTLEPAFASQLSQFGIDASIQTYGGRQFEEKRNNGDFAIWRSNRGTGFMEGAVAGLYPGLVVLERWARTFFRVFPEEQVNETGYGEFYISPSNLENHSNYTLQAPPIGEPDGELQTWKPARIGFLAQSTGNQEEYRDALQKLAWLYNWHMPVLPIANSRTQHFLDAAHWRWPSSDSNAWKTVGNEIEDLVASGRFVLADPDNPEEGATVEE